MTHSCVSGWLLVAMLSQPIAAQQQTSNARTGWPCGGRVDPSYFDVAEGTGGQLLLVAPEELVDSVALMTAYSEHPQTIFRLAGAMTPGLHEFRVPIDSSVESAAFSISVQCLQIAEVVRPSGAPVGGPDVTDLSNFRAQRMIIVKRPEAGVWTIRAAGSGVAGVMVQGRSALRMPQVEFAAVGSKVFTPTPLAGVENVVRIDMSGSTTQIEASVVDGAFRKIATLPLTVGETEGTYLSRFTAGAAGFRVLIEGKDANGVRFQRVHGPLFTPR